MASPTVEVREGAGAWTSTLDGFTATAASSLTIRLADTAGVSTWSLQCVSTDDINDTATINGGLSVDTVTYDATLTAPVAGSALILESVVNNGISNGISDPALTTRFKIRVLTADNREVIAVDETTEGSSVYGWAKAVNEKIREASTLGAAPGGSTGDMQYNNAGAFGGTGALSTDGTDLTIGSGVEVSSDSTLAKEGVVNTTNTSDHTVIDFDLSASNGLYVIDVLIQGVKSDGSIGKWWKVCRSFLNDAGVYTNGTLKSLDDDEIGGTPTWTVTIDRSSGTARVRVNSDGDNVNWNAFGQRVLRT